MRTAPGPARHRQDRTRSAHSGARGRIPFRARGLRQPQRDGGRASLTTRISRRCSPACRICDCISICTPPQAHFDAALLALRAGKHVMLEKPPTATTRQIALLAEEAARRGRTLFQTWHSRFAASVDAAREWLRTRKLTGGTDHLEGRRALLAPGPALDLGAGRFRRIRSRHQRAVRAHGGAARRSVRRERAARVSREPAGADRREPGAAHRRRRRASPRSSISARRASRAGTSSSRRPTARSSFHAAARDSRSTAGRSRATRAWPANIRGSMRASRSCAPPASRKSTGGRSSSSPMPSSSANGASSRHTRSET